MTLETLFGTPIFRIMARHLYAHEELRITSLSAYSRQSLSTERREILSLAHALLEIRGHQAYEEYLTRQLNTIWDEEDGISDASGASIRASITSDESDPEDSDSQSS